MWTIHHPNRVLLPVRHFESTRYTFAYYRCVAVRRFILRVPSEKIRSKVFFATRNKCRPAFQIIAYTLSF